MTNVTRYKYQSTIGNYNRPLVTGEYDMREARRLPEILGDKYYKRPDNRIQIRFINDYRKSTTPLCLY